MRLPNPFADETSATTNAPAPGDPESAGAAQSLIARLERLQDIAAHSDAAADEIAQAELLLSAALADCADSYIVSAADRLRAAQRLMSGLDDDAAAPHS